MISGRFKVQAHGKRGSVHFFVTRLVLAPTALLVVITMSFALVSLLPGDAARTLAGPEGTDEQVATIRQELGLDRPFAKRYLDYVADLMHGDLGTSFSSGRPVRTEIMARMPSTLELIALGLLCAVILGLTLGAVGAYFQNRTPDRITSSVMTVAQSIPEFFLALLLIYVGFYVLGWAPAPSGRLGFADRMPARTTGFLFLDSILAGEWRTLRSALAHSIVPALTLGFYYSAYIARTARSAIGEALNSEQIKFARACGIGEGRVLYYAFLEARTPILTYGGVLLGALVGGAALVELIFAWGGLGEWSLNGILRLDVPAIQGFVLVSGALTLLVFLALDALVMLLDPRVRYV